MMSTAFVNPYRVLGASAASRTAATPATGVAGLLHGLRAWLEEHRRFRETMCELSALTDRELDDIGLTRGDIEGVARRCANLR